MSSRHLGSQIRGACETTTRFTTGFTPRFEAWSSTRSAISTASHWHRGLREKDATSRSADHAFGHSSKPFSREPVSAISCRSPRAVFGRPGSTLSRHQGCLNESARSHQARACLSNDSSFRPFTYRVPTEGFWGNRRQIRCILRTDRGVVDLEQRRHFTQTIEAQSGTKEIIANGTWIYSASDRRITLADMRMISSKDCGVIQTCKAGELGNASLPVEREFGVGALRLGVEFDHPYVRQAP